MALNNRSSDSFQSTLILLQCSFLPCYSKTKRFLGPTGRNATHQIWIELFLGSCICSEWKCSDGFTNNFFDFLLNFRAINLTVLRYKSQTTIQWCELTTWKIEEHDCVQFCSVMWWIYHYPHILLHSLNNHDAGILLPLRAASLTNKNPQRRKIIHGMRPVGRKDLLIDLNMHVYL